MDKGLRDEIEENNRRKDEGTDDTWRTDPTDIQLPTFAPPLAGDVTTPEDRERQRVENDRVFRS